MKNFRRESTARLKALYETLDDEERTVVEEILKSRGVDMTPEPMAAGPVDDNASELAPEEEEAIRIAEANGGNNPMYNKDRTELTEEGKQALVEKLKEQCLYHACKIGFQKGIVLGVVLNKNYKSPQFRIQTEDGKQHILVYSSPKVCVLDEVLEAPKSGPKGTKVALTEEEIQHNLNAFGANIGRKVTFKAFAGGEELTGRIVRIMVDRRKTVQMLYQIRLENGAIKHKSIFDKALQLHDFDEEGEVIQGKVLSRRERKNGNTIATKLAKEKEKLEKLRAKAEEVEAKIKALEAEIIEPLAPGIPDEIPCTDSGMSEDMI